MQNCYINYINFAIKTAYPMRASIIMMIIINITIALFSYISLDIITIEHFPCISKWYQFESYFLNINVPFQITDPTQVPENVI